MTHSNNDDPQKAPTTATHPRFTGVLLRAALPAGILAAGIVAYSILSVETDKAKSPPAKAQAIRTRVATVRVQDYPVLIKTHGMVRPNNEIDISAQVSGQVVQISRGFEDGSFFSAGDVLVELDARDYRVAVEIADARLLGVEASLKLATLNHERNLEISKERLISDAEVDITAANLSRARAEVNSANAQLERAKRDFERTQIRAPFDGRVRQRNVGLGQLVGASTSLGVVFAVDFAEVRLPLAGAELGLLKLPESADDPPVAVELRDAIDATSTNVWQARIVRTEGALDRDSLELFAIARVDDPFGRVSGRSPLRIGQPVVGLITGRVLTDVVALPRVAVRQLDQVYLVDKTALTLLAHNIVPIWSDEEHYIVRDPVITNGSLVALTHLVYAPDGAVVEIIPDIDTNVPATATASSNKSSAAPAGKPVANKKS